MCAFVRLLGGICPCLGVCGNLLAFALQNEAQAETTRKSTRWNVRVCAILHHSAPFLPRYTPGQSHPRSSFCIVTWLGLSCDLRAAKVSSLVFPLRTYSNEGFDAYLCSRPGAESHGVPSGKLPCFDIVDAQAWGGHGRCVRSGLVQRRLVNKSAFPQGKHILVLCMFVTATPRTLLFFSWATGLLPPDGSKPCSS